jgi:two-component system nitrogen regulation response regulator GlnG
MQPSMLANARILVVEVDASVAAVCKDALDELGANATVVTTVSDAMLVASSLALDAIVSDVDLPDGSVDDLRELICTATERGRHTPLIVMSGYDLRSRYAGEDGGDYLQKPFHIDELTRAVSAALTRTRSGR